MKKYFNLVLFLGLTIIFLSGCMYNLVIPEENLTSGTQEDELGTGKGTLKIYLTDAPGDYKEVNIIISKIEGHIAADGEEGEDEGYWEVLKEWTEGLLVDLIKLEDVSILLASLELEPNKYTQIRLFLMGGEEDAWVVLEGSEGPEGPTSTEPLEIPSVYQTGIKLNRPFEIVAGMITKLTIDFDAEKSVVKTGNGKYKLKPVIHLTSEIYSEGEELPEGLGSVSGSVSYYESGNLALVGIGGANIELTGGAYIFVNTTTTTTSEEPDPEGTFILNNVPAGSYTLNVYAEGYDDYSESVVVVNDENTEVDIVFLTEEPGGILGIVKEAGSESTFISEATVTVTLSGGSTYTFVSFTETDTEGSFSITQLPVGFYTLTVSADDYSVYSHAFEIEVIEGETTDIGEIGLTLLP